MAKKETQGDLIEAAGIKMKPVAIICIKLAEWMHKQTRLETGGKKYEQFTVEGHGRHQAGLK